MIRDIVLNKNNISAFARLIPLELQKELHRNILTGFGYYDDATEAASITGTILLRRHGRWLELVWVALSDDYSKTEYSREMLDIFTYRASSSPIDYVGCYSELHPSEKELYDILSDYGFSFDHGKNGVYEFTIDMVQKDRLEGTDKYMDSCYSLEEADVSLISLVESQLKKDKRELPIDFPLATDDHDTRLSFVYSDGTACGIILTSTHEDQVVLDTMVSQSPRCSAVLLGALIERFEKLFDEGTVISVPVVSDKAADILRKLVPAATQKELLRGYLDL